MNPLVPKEFSHRIWQTPHHKGHVLDAFIKVSKFAPVCPVRMYREMMIAGFIPENVLLLAHDVASDQNRLEYDYVFNLPCWDNTNIIMDNSVVETGGAVDSDMVRLAADTVGADVVVLPDVLGDGAKSRYETCKAWESWYWGFRDYERMIVIQGKDEQDWLESAEEFVQYDPEWIAIPRVIETGRWERKSYLRYVSMLYPSARVHLLGFSDYVAADLVAASDSTVTSIDSAVPLRYSGPNLFSSMLPGRGTWWEEGIFDVSMIDRCKLIDAYIQRAA